MLDSYEPIVPGEFYGPRIERLAVVRLKVLHTEAKFKVGPAAPPEVKRQVVAGLRARNEPGDARAADVIEAAIRRGEGGLARRCVSRRERPQGLKPWAEGSLRLAAKPPARAGSLSLVLVFWIAVAMRSRGFN
ncbi:MAG: hypothetical protein U0841_20565 [Chloroflexia bacterium]